MKKRNDITKEELVKIGKHLQKLRRLRGYSNYELFAFDHGIARAQYGRYETGSDMRLSSLIRVLKALDINLKDFFDDEVFIENK